MQGRVERLNQTLTKFLARDLLHEKDWPSRPAHFYYTYNNRVHSATGKMPMEAFLRRPNFSMFNQQSRCQLTEEERNFSEHAHLDVEEGDDRDAGSGDDSKAYPLETQWNKQESIDGAGEQEEGPRSATARYSAGRAIYYHKPANLGGAAVVAALEQRWHAGFIADHHISASGFHLYSVTDLDGNIQSGRIPGSWLKPRGMVMQWLQLKIKNLCRTEKKAHRGGGGGVAQMKNVVFRINVRPFKRPIFHEPRK